MTTYVDQNGNEIFSCAMIAKNYIYGEFLIDFLATVPL